MADNHRPDYDTMMTYFEQAEEFLSCIDVVINAEYDRDHRPEWVINFQNAYAMVRECKWDFEEEQGYGE